MTDNDEILGELRKQSKIMLLSNAKTIEAELAKIATTNDRKKMWMYIDGNRMPKDIAGQVKVTQMAVSVFLNAALTAGFVEYERGKPPKRIFDYVPPSWLELVKLEETETLHESHETAIEGASDENAKSQ